MRSKIKPLIATALLGFSAWFYATPYLAVSNMKSAAEANDAERLSSYVNFPQLRENLKADFSAKLSGAAQRHPENGNDGLQALGAAMAVALINPMIDALVTPASLGLIMQGRAPRTGAPASAPAASTPEQSPEISMAYESYDRFVVSLRKKGSQDAPLRLVFRREQLIFWKLSAMQLPV